MTRRSAILTAGLIAAAALLVWAFFVALPRWTATRVAARPKAAAPVAAAIPGRKIKVHLFYVNESGMKLTSVDRDVPYGEGTVEQAKAIITSQLAMPTPPLLSAIPAGTTLRALFVTHDGEAF